jgi:hypothetical protein
VEGQLKRETGRSVSAAKDVEAVGARQKSGNSHQCSSVPLVGRMATRALARTKFRLQVPASCSDGRQG